MEDREIRNREIRNKKKVKFVDNMKIDDYNIINWIKFNKSDDG
ncbi:MAG: hypothetical protein Q8942_06920 [Bacillota bacterium]|nr:hypothetical protein [Bacillota bacterium]